MKQKTSSIDVGFLLFIVAGIFLGGITVGYAFLCPSDASFDQKIKARWYDEERAAAVTAAETKNAVLGYFVHGHETIPEEISYKWADPVNDALYYNPSSTMEMRSTIAILSARDTYLRSRVEDLEKKIEELRGKSSESYILGSTTLDCHETTEEEEGILIEEMKTEPLNISIEPGTKIFLGAGTQIIAGDQDE